MDYFDVTNYIGDWMDDDWKLDAVTLDRAIDDLIAIYQETDPIIDPQEALETIANKFNMDKTDIESEMFFKMVRLSKENEKKMSSM